jgi:hypothetical protein
MSLETAIYSTLKTLVDSRVYRDIVPGDKAHLLPRITFQQVGGQAVNFLSGDVPSKKNARVQINCWGARRDDVMALARLVEDAMRANTTLATSVLGAAMSTFEAKAGPNGADLYGAMQDFSLWYDD